jgi:hypothetical protein
MKDTAKTIKLNDLIKYVRKPIPPIGGDMKIKKGKGSYNRKPKHKKDQETTP